MARSRRREAAISRFDFLLENFDTSFLSRVVEDDRVFMRCCSVSGGWYCISSKSSRSLRPDVTASKSITSYSSPELKKIWFISVGPAGEMYTEGKSLGNN